MVSSRFLRLGILIASVFLLAAADMPSPNDPAQADLDRFMVFLSGSMFENGRITTISAKIGMSDEGLITAVIGQLNNRPAPLREWHILKKEHLGPSDFESFLHKKYPDQFQAVHLSGGNVAYLKLASQSNKFFVTVIDSEQGRKIIAIDENPRATSPILWARMYNCDAVFSSPQEGGTPLVR